MLKDKNTGENWWGEDEEKERRGGRVNPYTYKATSWKIIHTEKGSNH